MPYIVQRIAGNSYGWTKPSPGRLGRDGFGAYVKENGFGHEDWNFNLDLAIGDYLYGYSYCGPSPSNADEKFQIALVEYSGREWRLAGLYVDAEFASDGSPIAKSVLSAKTRHLQELKGQNSLGRKWAGLSAIETVEALRHEAASLLWKVQVKNVVTLSQSALIPKRIFDSRNYRMTTWTGIDRGTYNALRRLAVQTELPVEEEEEFPEGRELLFRHRTRERNTALVKAAKDRFRREHGRLFCQSCGFDFESVYGAIGQGFIEAHHVVPVSELTAGSKTKIEDVAMVCSNCHRMLHRRRPWLAISELSELRSEHNAGIVTGADG